MVDKLGVQDIDNRVYNRNLNARRITLVDTSLDAQTPFMLRVAKGEIVGHSIMSKFGQNDAVGTGAWEDVWDGGGTYPYPADGTAPITHLYSTVGETQDIEVQGLDINGDLVIQTITLTGTTVVLLTTALWRVFRLRNVGATNNAGVIHASVSDKATSYAQIAIGNNQTLMALYTIPNGKTGYLIQGTNSLYGISRDYSLNGKMAMRQYGGVFQLKKTFGLDSDGTSFLTMLFPLPGKIPAKTDIRVSAISIGKEGGVNTTFEILLVDN